MRKILKVETINTRFRSPRASDIRIIKHTKKVFIKIFKEINDGVQNMSKEPQTIGNA